MMTSKTFALTLIAGLSLYACKTGTSGRQPAGGSGDVSAPGSLPMGYSEMSSGDGWTTVIHKDGRRPGDKKRARFGRGGLRREAARSSDRAMPSAVSKGTVGRPRVPRRVGPLKAGEVDDNKAFADYVKYHRKHHRLIPAEYRLDISERYVIDVTDTAGRPLPNTVVRISAKGMRPVMGRTDSAGRLRFFPLAVGAPRSVTQFQVSFSYNGATLNRTFPRQGVAPAATKGCDKQSQANGACAKQVTTLKSAGWKAQITAKKQNTPVTLELVFLLDTTGSMSDEIARVQRTLLAITEKIRQMPGQPKIRYGMVLYRDRGDAYVTKRYGFTEDVKSFDTALRSVRANGGGDMPESMNMGLHAAVNQLEWSAGSLRLAFLVADAPPHLDYQQDVRYSDTLKQAVAKGIKIFPTAASGLDPRGSYVMRQIAQYTGARFLFIEYGRSGASHGVSGSYNTNNLDALILRIVDSELKSFTR